MVLGFSWDNQPRHSEPALILELPLADGILALLVLENRLVVEIGKANTNGEVLTDQWITPELVRSEKIPAVIALQWKEGLLTEFRLNAHDVPRSSEENEYFTVQSKPKDRYKEIYSDVASLNIDLRQKTSHRSTAFIQLVQTAIRLQARLHELRSSSPEVILDVAVLLRTLLCGSAKNGGRLLFRCAEEIGMVPVCYTFSGLAKDAQEVPFMDQYTIVLHDVAAGLPRLNLRIETNLGLWLDQPALVTLQTSLKHWELIREVANKFGAHADTDRNHTIFSFISPHDPGMNLGVLVPKFRDYGAMALEVSMVVIERARSITDGKIQ